jgi:glucose/arabinose dehydrogenase
MSAFAFDARGRLWVTRSGSSAHGNDGVYLVDRPGATPIKVVPSIRGPLGLVWVGSSLYVSYLGGVDRFDGFSGRRFAKRTTILKGSAAGGENNNLVLAPDGRFLMGVSAPCDHCPISPKYSAAIVSFRTDGTGLRLFATRIRAAYGLVFDGSTLYASMNQRDDLGAKTPGDWLAVVKQGEDWGFPACYGQGGSDCAGVPSPLGVLDPHSGAGGVAILKRVALVTEWTFGKVMSVQLGNGTTTTWVSGLQHALPVATRPDGSVLVGDWGRGIIYRVTGTG